MESNRRDTEYSHQSVLQRSDTSHSSGSVRVPPSSRNKAVISYSRTKEKYVVEFDFLVQLDNSDEWKKNLVEEFVNELNSDKKRFPYNQSIKWYLWVAAWLVTFFVIAVILWAICVTMLFFLLSPIVVGGCIWLLWFLVTRIPMIIVEVFTKYSMRYLKKFVNEYQTKNGTEYELLKKTEITCSSDGMYLELYFNVDEPDESVDYSIVPPNEEAKEK